TATSTGEYRIEVRSLDSHAPPGNYAIRVEEHLTVVEYQKRLASERARERDVIAVLRQKAIPLHSLAPGDTNADLLPLQATLKHVQVVGIGEATHGTREFALLRHRLLD